MIEKAIQLAKEKIELPQYIIDAVMDEIFCDGVSDSLIELFLTELSKKGETASEIAFTSSKLRSMYSSSLKEVDAVEIIGTGGDGSNSFNISTTAAFIAAGAGIPIIKHGNNASTSLSGSADVLDKLGVNIHISTEDAFDVFQNIGICFLYNAQFPSIMKKVAQVRRKLPFVTLFNKTRWITPANSSMEFLGVYSDELLNTMSNALENSNLKRATIVHGLDGLDEVSLSDSSKVVDISGNHSSSYIFKPEQYDLQLCKKEELLGGTPVENASITKNILQGTEKGAKRQISVLNAAFIIRVYCPNFSLINAIDLANESIDSENALKKLNALILATKNC